MRDNLYVGFTDLLHDMAMNPAFNSQAVEIMIRLDYFRLFGSGGKLLRLQQEFLDGEFRFSKAHVPATQQARLTILRRLEAEMPEAEIPPYEQLWFEIEHCGSPISTFDALRNEYAVLEVDDKYSPKLRLYNAASGKTGVMKVKKALYQTQPLGPGDIIRLLAWERKPAYAFADGKAMPRADLHDLWLTQYEILRRS